MDSIIESATPWRTETEIAAAPNAGDVDDDDGFQPFGDDGFTFLDFLDIINPLQHIPVISTLYREMTDDTLDPGSRVIGGTLFFGPVGTVVSIANVLIDDATGKDMGEHVMAFFENEEPDAPGNGPSEERAVADIGARAGLVQPDAPQPFRSPGAATALPANPAPGALDPITAWAKSEVAFRHSNVGKGRLMLEGEIQDPEFLPAQERATAPKSVTTGALAPKAPGWKDASPYVPVKSAASVPTAASVTAPRPIALDGPVVGIQALAALRQDLKAGGDKKAAEAASVARETRQNAALFAASAYGPQMRAFEARKSRTERVAPSDTPPGTPPGAVAPEGGWFSETMLSAYGKYQNNAGLAGRERPVALDLTR